ncbi:MAG: Permease of the drug/metabolite transporter (DMT) superfamily [Chloroflexi bacterium]|jgi:drug/metabolite transporter (DMT)-like permease|nr:MAG: Permease of the drug/metabolite transporter (DMT) superfamily [Chloroflexota bacterium]
MGIALALIAALCFSTGTITVRFATQHLRPTSIVAVSSLWGSAVAFVVAFIFFRDEIWALTGVAFAWFTVVAFVNFLMARLLSYTSIYLAGVVRTTPVHGSQPLWGSMFAVVLLGEEITPMLIAGTLAVTLGVMLVLWDGVRR